MQLRGKNFGQSVHADFSLFTAVVVPDNCGQDLSAPFAHSLASVKNAGFPHSTGMINSKKCGKQTLF